MGRLRVLPNGATATKTVATNNNRRGRRADARGWTDRVARANAQWLQSIDVEAMADVELYSLTLTVRANIDRTTGLACNVPPSGLYHGWIHRFFKRLARDTGMCCYHWVIEMTGAHMPHVHASIGVLAGTEEAVVVAGVYAAWRGVVASAGWSTSSAAIDCKRMSDVGWMEYTAKHGARGVRMYQRESSAMPASWRDHPGKVWGHSRVSADWSVPGWRAAIPLDFDLDYGTGDSRGFWLYRRLARRWLLSKVVRFRDPKERAKQIAYTRRMLKCGLDANESVAGLDLNEPIPSESPESPESPGGVGVDPWDYPVPEHGVPTRIGEILDRELVGSHMKSDRRARNLWITGNANMQLLQWLADNADEIGCNVVQIGGDIPVLEGVPIVSEETE